MKRLIFLLCALFMLIGITGCSGDAVQDIGDRLSGNHDRDRDDDEDEDDEEEDNGDENDDSDIDDEDDDATPEGDDGDDASSPAPSDTTVEMPSPSAPDASGRSSGQVYMYDHDEVATSTFFSFAVNSATVSYEVADYVPTEDTNTFLIINITVENVFDGDSSIPMFYDDFVISWDALGDDYMFPEDEFAVGQLPNEYELAAGEERSGDLIFVVPNDVTTFQLIYTEYWDDDFEGDTYVIEFDLSSVTQSL